MSSILIYGGSAEVREEKARERLVNRHIHQVEGEKGKIGIGQIKELLPQLHLKPPQGQGRGVLILEAQQMTPAAQNALLKTLEEPPPSLTFVLTAPHSRLLLPTVVSRCLLKVIRDVAREREIEPVQKILSASPGQRLALFEEQIGYQTDAAVSFLDTLEIELSKEGQTPTTAAKLQQIWETKKLLRDPLTNIKLAVDHFLLSC